MHVKRISGLLAEYLQRVTESMDEFLHREPRFVDGYV